MLSKQIAAILCLMVSTSGASAAEAILTGHARTVDGDTIEIGGVPVRLKGIAAPERDEPGGVEATEAMRRLIGDNEVRCELTGERTHQRAVGYCSAGGMNPLGHVGSLLASTEAANSNGGRSGSLCGIRPLTPRPHQRFNLADSPSGLCAWHNKSEKLSS